MPRYRRTAAPVASAPRLWPDRSRPRRGQHATGDCDHRLGVGGDGSSGRRCACDGDLSLVLRRRVLQQLDLWGEMLLPQAGGRGQWRVLQRGRDSRGVRAVRVAERASAISHSAKATGVRRRCCALHTLMPGGTSPPLPLPRVRPPLHQCVGWRRCAYARSIPSSTSPALTPTRYSHVRLRATWPHCSCSTSIEYPKSSAPHGRGRSHRSQSFDPAGCSSTPPQRRTCSTASGAQSCSAPW